jgi:hypothetical protein
VDLFDLLGDAEAGRQDLPDRFPLPLGTIPPQELAERYVVFGFFVYLLARGSIGHDLSLWQNEYPTPVPLSTRHADTV